MDANSPALSANSPQGASRPPKFVEKAIAARWLTWLPWVMAEAKRTGDPAAAFGEYKERHRRRLLTLIRAGISQRAIHAADLDDPRRLGTEFDRLLVLAMERRSRLLSRVKGKRKPPHRTTNRKMPPRSPRAAKGRTDAE